MLEALFLPTISIVVHRVLQLQHSKNISYLIQADAGAAAKRLVGAGATGNFGPITKAALVEYQGAAGISPASGYYGPITRAFVAAHPIGTLKPAVSSTSSVGATGAALIRNLYLASTGEDVRTLQKLLNANGYPVAVIGVDSTGSPRAGSLGHETTYFGKATQAAVIRFQIARRILPAVGYVGPVTRAMLASL